MPSKDPGLYWALAEASLKASVRRTSKGVLGERKPQSMDQIAFLPRTPRSVTRLVEAEAVHYDLDAQNGWLPDLKSLAAKDLSKVKLMWVNYPHMPTGAM